MKSIIKIAFALCLALGMGACNEDILDEHPLSSLSPENAYVTKSQFDQAVWELHRFVRDQIFFESDGSMFWTLFMGADIAINPIDLSNGAFGDYRKYVAGNYFYQWYYRKFYLLIARANTVIDRAVASQSRLSADEKVEIIGQAKFFRAYAYRCLANLYGGVPKIDHEVTSPKRDFVRASRAEIYDFCREDLEYASTNLTRKAGGTGQITAGVADHLLAEIYICLERWDDAIAAASRIIDDKEQYGLMTERFGKRMDQEGDVFWDLFRTGNVNRADGNKETIWALQYEFNVPGGHNTNIPTWNAGYSGERAWGPRYWTLLDPDGNPGTVATDALGRGASFIRPTYYAHTHVFKSCWDDMRNSKYNIMREFFYNNPASAYYGQKIETLYNQSDTLMAFYPYYMKVLDAPHQSDFAQAQSFRDFAVMRVAETYLLRAEAYLGKGRKDLAANDINEVRSRAHATPVPAAEVDIDYILDERVRELMTEEMRQLTLCRLGKLAERCRAWNPISGPTVDEHNNLWAIPQSEIDLNSDVYLGQNPGY